MPPCADIKNHTNTVFTYHLSNLQALPSCNIIHFPEMKSQFRAHCFNRGSLATPASCPQSKYTHVMLNGDSLVKVWHWLNKENGWMDVLTQKIQWVCNRLAEYEVEKDHPNLNLDPSCFLLWLQSQTFWLQFICTFCAAIEENKSTVPGSRHGNRNKTILRPYFLKFMAPTDTSHSYFVYFLHIIKCIQRNILSPWSMICTRPPT